MLIQNVDSKCWYKMSIQDFDAKCRYKMSIKRLIQNVDKKCRCKDLWLWVKHRRNVVLPKFQVYELLNKNTHQFIFWCFYDVANLAKLF